MVQINKQHRTLRSVDEVMALVEKQAPTLLERCFLDRDWIWICNVDLRGEANLPIREAIKEIGFRFSPDGHVMPDGRTRGHWGHSCNRPMHGKRRGKGKTKFEKEEETDMAAAFRSLGM